MDKVKVVFPLEQDDEGYPPVEIELVWATPLEELGFCRLENIPFYAVGVSLHDEISVSFVDGRTVFNGHVRDKGHSTFRVVVFDASDVPAVIRDIKESGGSCEVSNIATFLAVDVPDASLVPSMRRTLGTWLLKRRIDIEESNVRA